MSLMRNQRISAPLSGVEHVKKATIGPMELLEYRGDLVLLSWSNLLIPKDAPSQPMTMTPKRSKKKVYRESVSIEFG